MDVKKGLISANIFPNIFPAIKSLISRQETIFFLPPIICKVLELYDDKIISCGFNTYRKVVSSRRFDESFDESFDENFDESFDEF